MSGSPPDSYRPTGIFDDLLALLAREEFKRNKDILPDKGAAARHLVEPFLNFVALGLWCAARLASAERMLRVQDWVYRRLTGSKVLPFDEGSANLAAGGELARRAEAATGRRPALLCLLSHPPVFGGMQWLNVELFRHSLLALRRLRGAPCRPSLVIAVDHFALDTLPVIQEGLYASFMGLYHLGIDRLAHSRPWLSRLMIAKTSWRTIAGRISRRLAAGLELSMVLAGGVPTTGRLLYCAREHVGRLRAMRDRTLPPHAALRELARLDADFARFLDSGQVGDALRKNAWRTLEAWILARIIQGPGLSLADEGKLSASARAALEAAARALGCPEAAAASSLSEFEEEFARETPYRERFFRFVARRVASRRPLVIVPLTHGRPGAVRIACGEPAAVLGARRDRGETWLRVLRGEDEREVPLRDFCRDFIRRNYD